MDSLNALNNLVNSGNPVLPEPDLTQQLIEKLYHRRQCIFLTGAGGVGKSYVTKQIAQRLSNVATLASTGTAALLIGGQTVHSFFRLGISRSVGEMQLFDQKNINEMSERMKVPLAEAYRIYFYKLEQLLMSSRAIIIDEVSMLTRKHLDMIHHRYEQFGVPNMPTMLVGDLLQLPPVKSDSLIFDSPHFAKYEPIYLTEVKRTSDLDFIDVQHKLREGKVDNLVKAFMMEHDRKISEEDRATHVNLFSLKAKAEAYNKRVLKAIDAPLFKSTTKLTFKDDKVSNTEATTFINDLLVGAELSLKVGARVMFVKNSEEFVNGELGELIEVDIDTKSLIIKKDNGNIVTLFRDTFEKNIIEGQRGNLKIRTILRASQYPIILAAAVSIHKSQGLTIPKLYVDLQSVFEAGQLYVGISRASDPSNLVVKNFNTGYVKVNQRVLEFYRSLK